MGPALAVAFLAQVGLILVASAGPAAAQVTKVDTQVALVSTVNPSVFGQSVMFFATVVPADPLAGTPSGTMQFRVDGANLGDLIALNGGQAVVSTLSLSVGTHTVAAVYSGDAVFNGSTGSLAGGQTVNKANSRVLLSSSINPSVFGQQVAFTAVIRPVAPGSGNPQGGTVQFRVDGADFGSPVAVSGGQAALSTTALAVGSHTVAAVFSGDASFNGSTGTLAAAQVVNKAGTTTPVTSSVNPSLFGQPVTFTATVRPAAPGSGSPDGSVQFAVGGVNLGGPILLSAGAASISTNALAVGTQAVTASYGGGASFNGSTGALAGGQTVNKADTTTHVASNHNPSVFGQPVTLTATVNVDAPGAGTPRGTVQFMIDGKDFGQPVDLSGGQATISTGGMEVGDHAVKAVYSGNGSFNGSFDTLSQSVNRAGRADTSTRVTSNHNPSVFGQQVTFTASVSVDPPGAGTPDGTVQFTIDGDARPPVSLSGGQASITLNGLSVGNHSVRADYSGTGDFNGSADSLTQAVNRADTSTQVVSSANPSVVGSSVTFTAQVVVNAPGAGTPAGTIQFQMDGADLGPGVTLQAGSASVTTIDLSAGTHAIAGVYSGDGNFAGSSDSLSQSIQYATGDCQGAPGRQILPPINAGDPVSDVNAGSTVPAKFGVCDANGDTVGTPGVIQSFELVKWVSDQGGEEVLHQPWTDGEFKYSNHAWKLNIDTKSLDGGFTYFWSIHLDDGTSIDFRFHLKGGSSTSPGKTKEH